MLSTWRERTGTDRAVLAAGAVALTLAAVAAASFGLLGGQSGPGSTTLTAVTRRPTTTASVLSGAPAAVAARAASTLFASAPLVVLADASQPAELKRAEAKASRAHAPLLLIDRARASAWVALRTAIRALAARDVLAVGVDAGTVGAKLPGIQVVSDPSQLPATKAAAPLHHIVLVVRQRDTGAGAGAAMATALAAGVPTVTVSGNDPRADPAAITALSADRPAQVLAVGAAFGPARLLASRVAVAATGVQLPGGGQVLFPMHRLLALYGYPGSPVLGALGQQSLPASIARIRRIAAVYRPLSSVPVVPAFEIIATVAQSRPGPEGTYSYESSVASLRPWVRRATAAGMYVVLDLQAGRASLLTQARRYRSLLRLPNVGLALDPEWKLQPSQLPLRQIGSVTIGQVNGVAGWLSWLTARYRLPQKLLVLHQFRLSMISDEQLLNTRHDNLAIVIHMDGQGTPASKLGTWNAVTANAPPGVFFGWKNFYTKDTPTLSPARTMANRPQPVMISYQ